MYKKFMLVFVLILMLTCSLPSSANCTETVTFELLMESDPGKFQQTEIAIRGFLYQSNGQLILAAEPNLKSCCVANPTSIKRQIVVVGPDFNSVNTLFAVLLQGVLTVDTQNHFILINANIVEQKHNNLIWIFVFLIVILLGLYFYKNSLKC